MTRGSISRNFLNVKIENLARFLSISNEKSFNFLALALILGLDENNIDEEMIIDGEGDKQIDAIYISQKGNKKIIDLVQLKKASGFSSNIVIQIGNGLNWVFEKNGKDVGKLKNFKFRDKINEIRDGWDENMTVNVYYCALGDESEIEAEALEQADLIRSAYSKHFDKFNFSFIGVQKLYDLIQQREKIGKIVEEKIYYEFHPDAPSLVEYQIEDFGGVICSVNGEEIAKLVERHGDNLFEANIRRFLGENKVNKNILETAVSDYDSQRFWFFNNGITLVCDSSKIVRNPKKPYIHIYNAQIVNGCQTATTLFNAYKDKKLRTDIRVLVKIFSTKDEQFVNKITEATNNQTSISTRDLRANDKAQILIEKYFKEKYGYFYERKRGQYKNSNINKNIIINNEKVAQAFWAVGKIRPSIAKSSKTRLFSEDFYDDIFSKPVEYLLLCYKIVEYAEKEKRKKSTEEMEVALRIYGFLHISRMMAYYLLDGESVLNLTPLKVDEYINLISKNNPLGEYYKRSFNVLLKKLRLMQKRGKIKNLNNFFKSSEAEDWISKILKSK
ncbi:MAG: AIPR family protein [bacterium]|nr:AIPR family protein [bacterium]